MPHPPHPPLPVTTGLDLPAAPLFKDALEKVIIPQVGCWPHPYGVGVCGSLGHEVVAGERVPVCLLWAAPATISLLLLHLTGCSTYLSCLCCALAQVPIFDILKKFDGQTVNEDIKHGGPRQGDGWV